MYYHFVHCFAVVFISFYSKKKGIFFLDDYLEYYVESFLFSVYLLYRLLVCGYHIGSYIDR